MTCFAPATDGGQDLLDHHVAPICAALDIALRVVRPPANRATGLRAKLDGSAFVLWDGSLEDERGIYDALTLWAKLDRSNIIVSRTPLPQNVLTWNQFAPPHGGTLDNARIGAWLHTHLAARLGRPAPPAVPTTEAAAHYWMYERPARYFLSHRGTHHQAVAQWRTAFERERGRTVRVVPAQEFSYPTEVVTRAQMWEGVARLFREIAVTGRMLVYLTADYFDSFWCASELLGATELARNQGLLGVVGRGRNTPPPVELALPGRPDTTPFAPVAEKLGLRPPGREELRRFRRLLANCDPLSCAPETVHAPRGAGRLIAALVKPFGFYDAEVVREDFWSVVRVPCPGCAPRHRSADRVDWQAHVAAPPPTGTDAFGYFPAAESDLARGVLTCPTCATRCRLVNRRGARVLWTPVMSTEADQNRPVVRRIPLWEVLPPG
ncbi:hypothetical protein ACWD25_51410 [Streptomyces sp. NPDC002920]